MLLIAACLSTPATAAPGPAATAPKTGFARLLARLFGPSDDDGDGIADRRDACLTLPETVNGYADDDGCPDHLAILDAGAWWGEELQRATFEVTRHEQTSPASGPRLADDLVPGEIVTVSATAGCLVAQETVVVRDGLNRLDLRLQPVRDRPLEITAQSPDGIPVEDAVVAFGPSPCLPSDALALTGGSGEVAVGAGLHGLTVSAPGFHPAHVQAQPGVPLRITLQPRTPAPAPSGDQA